MEAILGGMMIGAAVSMMLLFNGRVTGISGITGDVLAKSTLDRDWRLFFLGGLLVGGFILKYWLPSSFVLLSNAGPSDHIIAGFLIGLGTLMGNGCTSGHGICGLSRWSLRSLVLTVTFIISGILGVMLFKQLRGEL